MQLDPERNIKINPVNRSADGIRINPDKGIKKSSLPSRRITIGKRSEDSTTQKSETQQSCAGWLCSLIKSFRFTPFIIVADVNSQPRRTERRGIVLL
jgi:hypothetical protein